MGLNQPYFYDATEECAGLIYCLLSKPLERLQQVKPSGQHHVYPSTMEISEFDILDNNGI